MKINKREKINWRVNRNSLIILSLVLLAIWFFAETVPFTRASIVGMLVILILLLLLLLVHLLFDLKIYQYAFFFLLICGTVSLFIQPIFNIPDEATHYARAEYISRGNLVVDQEDIKHKTIQAVYDLMEQKEKTYKESTIKNKKIDTSPVDIEHIAASNNFIVYIPQTMGISLSKALNLDLIWTMWLGRFMNLLCYCGLVALALKITGGIKNTIFFIAALPMSIQQAASFSPDAIINGSVFLLVGYFLHLYKKNNPITWRNILIFTILGCLVILSKVTNIFFCGLILLVPFSDEHKKINNVVIKGSIILIFVVLGGMYYLYTTQFPIPDVHKEYMDTVGVNSNEQIQYIISNFISWMHSFGAVLIEKSTEYIDMLSNFGWLKYNYQIITVLSIFMFGKIVANEQKIGFNYIQKGLICLMILGNYAFSCLALYIGWTPVGSRDLYGVQGRYFIPLLVVLGILLATNEKIQEEDNKILNNDILIMLIMIGMMLLKTITVYY